MSDYRNDTGNLFRWKRMTKNPIHSKSNSQKYKTERDIKDWIKTVESASSKATDEVFGRSQGSRAVKAAASAVHAHEDAYSEAHMLLQEWMTDKVHLDAEVLSQEEDDESWIQGTDDAKKYWDEILREEGISHAGTQSSENWAGLTGAEVDVSDVVQHLMEKPVVNKRAFIDNDKDKDPKLKMELRHKQVKESRLKREKDLQERRKTEQMKKEAAQLARKQVMEEEKRKRSRKLQEESLIQQEMAKIKRQLEEEKSLNDKIRKKALLDLRAAEALELAERREQQRLEAEAAEDIRRQELAEAEKTKRIVDLIQRRTANRDAAAVQRCFNAWYDVTLQRRLQMGRARALCDWRLLRRSLHGWRAVARNNRLTRENERHQLWLMQRNRNEQLASSHHSRQLLSTCFRSWCLFVKQTQLERTELQRQDEMKNKMQSFLQAVQTGRLNEKEDLKTEETVSTSTQQLEDMFAQGRQVPVVKPQAVDNTKDLKSRVRDPSYVPHYKRKVKPPTEAWQVTQKHLRLPLPKPEGSSSEEEGEASGGVGAPVAVSVFEHRHAAQQKLLKEQQKALREQRRMIEDLQHQQKMAELKKDVSVTEAIQKEMEKLKDPEKLNYILKHLTQKPPESEGRDDETVISDEPDTARTKSSILSAGSRLTGTSKDTEFVMRMQQRQEERARLKREREQRKRQQEEERAAQLMAEAEQKKKDEIEEKKAKARELKKKRELLQQREEHRQRVQKHQDLQTSKAKEHYEHRVLLYHRGLKPWMKLVEIKRQQELHADTRYRHSILRKVLSAWHYDTQLEVTRKMAIAEDFYNTMIVRRMFANWTKFRECQAIAEARAVRHYTSRLQSRLLRHWADWALDQKLNAWRNEQRAAEHNQLRIVRTAFRTWRRLPHIAKEEREREKTREQLRRRVAQLLPDYRAPDD